MWTVSETPGGFSGTRVFWISNGEETLQVERVLNIGKTEEQYLRDIKEARKKAAQRAAVLNESPTYP